VLQHYWSSLFAHEGAVYFMGASNDTAGAVRLSRTTDDGLSWAQATLRGGERYTTGATAVTFAQGRVWRALEGGKQRAAMVFSAPAGPGADLLDPAAWRRTAPLAFNLSWIPASLGPVAAPAQPWVEGNALEGPDGLMYNLLRLESGWSKARPVANKAILLRVPARAFDAGAGRGEHGDAPPLEFVAIVDMPGGSCKFTARRHAASGVYFALTNNVTNVTVRARLGRFSALSVPYRFSYENPFCTGLLYGRAGRFTTKNGGFRPGQACPSARNVLTLVSSRDLRRWAAQLCNNII
jgi:hypothetical protein